MQKVCSSEIHKIAALVLLSLEICKTPKDLQAGIILANSPFILTSNKHNILNLN
jgi:hypothetical protein